MNGYVNFPAGLMELCMEAKQTGAESVEYIGAFELFEKLFNLNKPIITSTSFFRTNLLAFKADDMAYSFVLSLTGSATILSVLAERPNIIIVQGA